MLSRKYCSNAISTELERHGRSSGLPPVAFQASPGSGELAKLELKVVFRPARISAMRCRASCCATLKRRKRCSASWSLRLRLGRTFQYFEPPVVGTLTDRPAIGTAERPREL